MMNTGKLAGKTLFITGGCRGIGKEIALKAAKDGGNIILAAETAVPGTIYTAAEDVKRAGGKALPCIVDGRSEEQILEALKAGEKEFGGIDVLVDNTSVDQEFLIAMLESNMKEYDLKLNINSKCTFLASKVCLPYLKKSSNPHILNVISPLSINRFWFQNHVAYKMAKYSISMCVLGMSDEFRRAGIAVNALWPKTVIQTAANEVLMGDTAKESSRKTEIMADAAYLILCKDSQYITGQFFIDEEVLLNAKALPEEQIAQCATIPDNKKFSPYFFVDEVLMTNRSSQKVFQQIRQMSTRTARRGGIEGIITTLNEKFNADIVNETQAIYQFNITSRNGREIYHIDLRNGSGSAGKGKSEENPDTIFSIDAENFNKLVTGNLQSPTAFMTGRMKITGSMQKAAKLEKLFVTLMDK